MGKGGDGKGKGSARDRVRKPQVCRACGSFYVCASQSEAGSAVGGYCSNSQCERSWDNKIEPRLDVLEERGNMEASQALKASVKPRSRSRSKASHVQGAIRPRREDTLTPAGTRPLTIRPVPNLDVGGTFWDGKDSTIQRPAGLRGHPDHQFGRADPARQRPSRCTDEPQIDEPMRFDVRGEAAAVPAAGSPNRRPGPHASPSAADDQGTCTEAEVGLTEKAQIGSVTEKRPRSAGFEGEASHTSAHRTRRTEEVTSPGRIAIGHRRGQWPRGRRCPLTEAATAGARSIGRSRGQTHDRIGHRSSHRETPGYYLSAIRMGSSSRQTTR